MKIIKNIHKYREAAKLEINVLQKLNAKVRKKAGDDVEAIDRLFNPEFRNRLDAIVSFNSLSDKVIARVVEKFILELESQLDNKNVFIEISEKAALWLGKEGYDENMGARPLSRLIQEKIKKPIAEEILYGKLSNGGNIRVDLKDKQLTFDFKPFKKAKKNKKLRANL